jgi:DNA ligase (NAD+)
VGGGVGETARTRPPERLLTAIGIRHVGSTVARRLVQAFGSIPALLAADPETIAAVEGVGGVIAGEVAAWASDPANRKLVERLEEAGVRMEAERAAAGARSSVLEGVSLVVSGTLEGYSREEAEAAIEAAGGRATSSVSGKTLALVVGEEPGASKVSKAESLAVPIVDEATFERLLAEGPEVLG